MIENRQAWLWSLMSFPSTKWARNVVTNFETVRIGKSAWPMTLNETEYSNSYVCSPYTAFISYAREELQKIPVAPARVALRALLSVFDRILVWAQINRTINVNNWLLSTNLYDASSEDSSVENLIRPFINETTAKNPHHAVLFRSLNCHSNPGLMRALKNAGLMLMPTRQVYIFDPDLCRYTDKINTKRDLTLLSDKKFDIVPQSEFCETDFPRLEELYNELYLEKYSRHNPQFTADFLKLCAQTRSLTLYGLRDREGTYQGVIGYFTVDKIMTTPIVGYNLKLPQKLALYRRLIAIAIRDANERGLILNLSSGAPVFKRNRGGVPFIEYCAVYIKHLPLRRRFVFGALSAILNGVGAPLLKWFKL